MAIALQKSDAMPPQCLRWSVGSPLAALVGGVLLVACGSDDGSGTLSPYRPGEGTPSGAGTGSTSSSGSSTGSSSPSAGNSGSTGSSSGSGSSSGGSSAGSSSGASGTPEGGIDAGRTTPPAPATPAFAITVDDAAPSLNLAETKVVTVTVTPKSWTGAVTLSAAGLPSDVKGVFDSPTVNVSGSAPVTAKLTLTSIDASKPVATPFQIVGTVGQTAQDAPATLTVNPYITINLPLNADSFTTSFGTVHISAPANIATNPVTVNFVNLDATPHEIHAGGGKQGFGHGQGTFAQGQADSPVRKVKATGTYSWYLHDNAPPGGPPGGIVIIK